MNKQNSIRFKYSIGICINETTPFHRIILQTASKMSSDEQDIQLQGVAFQKYLQNKKTESKGRKVKDRQCKEAKKNQTEKMRKVWNIGVTVKYLCLTICWKKIVICGTFFTYSKHDEITYTELASSLYTTTDFVKTKMNDLRAQLGPETAKVNIKSGQGTNEPDTSS